MIAFLHATTLDRFPSMLKHHQIKTISFDLISTRKKRRGTQRTNGEKLIVNKRPVCEVWYMHEQEQRTKNKCINVDTKNIKWKIGKAFALKGKIRRQTKREIA